MNAKTILQNLVYSMPLKPQLKDDGDFSNNTYVDTKDKAAVGFLIQLGDTDVAAGDAVGSTAEGTALKIEECDTVDGIYTDVSGAALSEALQYNDDGKQALIIVDKTNGTFKRYMRVNAPHSAAGAANGSNLCIAAIAVPDNVFPATDAERGLKEMVVA